MVDFDYVIVGAGAVGCVLANRLSEDPDNQVLLLEDGGGDTNPHAPGQSERVPDDLRAGPGCLRMP